MSRKFPRAGSYSVAAATSFAAMRLRLALISRSTTSISSATMSPGIPSPSASGSFLELGAPVFVAEDLLDRIAHPLPVEPVLGVDDLLLLGVDQVEQQHLEDLRRPVLDLPVLLLAEMADGLRCPDAAEAMVECLVTHHQLDQPAQHGIVGLGVESGERAHRHPFDQHLHSGHV